DPGVAGTTAATPFTARSLGTVGRRQGGAGRHRSITTHCGAETADAELLVGGRVAARRPSVCRRLVDAAGGQELPGDHGGDEQDDCADAHAVVDRVDEA